MRRAKGSKQFAGCFATGASVARDTRLVFAGLACDRQSSFSRGCARGPTHIRNSYISDCYNSTTESGVDLAGRVADLGDLGGAASWKKTAARYESRARSIFAEGKLPFFAGGDHAVSIPVARALAALGRPVHVVQLDAHPDLYPEYENDRESHACVAARLLEMEHIASVTQMGIRTMNAIQESTARRYGERLRIVPAREIENEIPAPALISGDALVYLTLDLDVFDPGFAPGVSHPVPGGLSPRVVLDFLQRIAWNLVGMDVVELNPRFDQHGLTAVLAGRLLH
ncbi:MAG: arginase family protein, partial [Acidobacteriales bacterium]|nr:arginase family protein [Terriglobales bacterium]